MIETADRKKLTRETALKLPAPRKGQLLYFDSSVPQLAVRVLSTGGRAWVVNTTHEGKSYRRTLGKVSKLTAEQARKDATATLTAIRAGSDPLVERRAKRRAESEAAAEHAAAQEWTLSRLLEAYAADLEERGARGSAGDARSLFRTWVGEEGDQIAREVAPETIAGIVGRPLKGKKERTAAKLRSYMRAAYARAVAARLDPRASDELRGFGITANPAATVPAVKHVSVNQRRNYPEAELRAEFGRLSKATGAEGRIAWLAALLGGQRPTQLLRARVVDFDAERETLMLFDGKGRRTQPREHLLPLTGAALPIVKAFAEEARKRKSEWLFSRADKGAIRLERVEEAFPNAFQLKDVRAACNTLLIDLRIDRDVRDQILSHGLGSVESRHYDRHDYLPRIQTALEKLHARLAELASAKRAKVIKLPRKK
jgi:hypothetical protein